MTEHETVGEIIGYLEKKGYFIMSKFPDLMLEFPYLKELVKKGKESEINTYLNYLKYVVDHFHKKYHFRYLGLPEKAESCPDDMCKAINRDPI